MQLLWERMLGLSMNKCKGIKMAFNYNHKNLSRIAAVLYLLMIPLGFIGILYLPENVIVLNDAHQTLVNFRQHKEVLSFSVLSAFFIQVIQVFLVVCLYKLLKQNGVYTAIFMVIFTITAVPIAMFNELSLIASIWLDNNPSLLNGINDNQINNVIFFLLNMHEKGIMVVHVFWGLWLIPMGLLVYKSPIIPKFIGVLLIIGGGGYCLDTVTYFLTNSDKFMIAQYTFLGEILLPIALLWASFKKID